MQKLSRLRTLVAALSAAGLGLALSAPAAAADEGVQFKFRGYGTLAATHFSEDDADFVGNIFQPDGAGQTKSWSFEPDSVFGGQLDILFNDKLSAVLQVVAQHQYDDTFRPRVEWANVKYQVTPDFSVRAGRIAAPSYLLSESRFVGYANPWLRPPVEAYSVLSITSNDGVDATYRNQIGSATNTFQAYYGTSTARLSTGKVESKPAWGFNDTVEMGSLTLRAGYTSVKLDADIPSTAPLFGGMAFLAPQLLDKYSLDNLDLSAVALGASYDTGTWFVMSELVEFFGDGLLSDSTSWYVSGGYRFGAFTPYATYSSTKAHIDEENSGTLLDGGINQALAQFTPTQHTTSIGMRWDFRKNMALKTQYDYITLGKNSNGRLRVESGAPAPAKHSNVFSVALDFVF